MEAVFFEDYLEPSLPLSLPFAIDHDEAHYRKYILFGFCAFLGFFRPSLNWQESSEHRRLAASLLAVLWNIIDNEGQRRKFITLLFDSRENLDAIPKELVPKTPQPSRAILGEHVPIVREAWQKFPTWDKRIAYMHRNGVRYQGKSLAEAYKGKPDAVSRTLQRVIEELNNQN